MQIKVYPIDLVKRCVWDSYVYYVLGSEKEAQRILEENLEMEIPERDALVIGLLKVIETDNLIHKFNTYITEILSNRSTSSGSQLLIRKRVLDLAVDKFLDKFPDYWIPSTHWSKVLKDLVEYINIFKKDIEKLEVYSIVDKNLTIEFYGSNNVKKLLKFQY
jgi:hypothetical protein